MMRAEIIGRTFQWDDDKARRNKIKHGISFETVALVFEDENRIERYDEEHSVDEDRWITVGKVGDILFVVYTERGKDIRLISARAADEDERREYDECNSSDDP